MDRSLSTQTHARQSQLMLSTALLLLVHGASAFHGSCLRARWMGSHPCGLVMVTYAEYLASRNGGVATNAEPTATRIDAVATQTTGQTNVPGDTDVYAWLDWAPPKGSPTYDTLHRCFPGAIPGSVVRDRSVHVVSKFGLTPENTIYGQSICPDEINNEKGDLSSLMIDHWGEVFPMGGIGGVPFVGKTGFGAFSAHVPSGVVPTLLLPS